MSKEKITDVDFEPLREPWNKYSLRDGSSIKARLILRRVILKETRKLDGSIGEKNYGIDTQTITVAYNVPEELKGQPSELLLPPPELQAGIVENDIHYDTLAQEWNEYIADDGTKIKLQLTVVKVSRTKFTDKFGNPVYFIESSTTINIAHKKP